LKKLCFLSILLVLLFQCGKLDRNNPLDPKNPGADLERTILAELFVNDSTGYEYCNYALDAMEKLAQRGWCLSIT